MSKNKRPICLLKEKLLKGRFIYDPSAQVLFNEYPNGHMQRIADVRAWGAIQNLFIDGRDRLDTRKAEQFQDMLGAWLAESLNAILDQD